MNAISLGYYEVTLGNRKGTTRKAMKKETAAPATEKQQDAAAPMVFANSFNQSSDSFNYENELEITADEMSDELFAAVARGDTDTVARLTGGASKFAGPGMLLSKAQENRDTQKQPDYTDADLGGWQDAGMTQMMMYRTGGNAQLAKLLLSQLQTNYLLSIGGVMADEMARDMGNHNLSEFLRQMQREEAARIDEVSAFRRHFNDRREFLIGYSYLEAAMHDRPAYKPVIVEAEVENKGFFQNCADCITGFFNSASSSKPMALEIVEMPTIGSTVRNLVQRFAPAF